MKWGLLLGVIILMSCTVSALNTDLSNSKYSSEIFKIKFDDNPNTIIYNFSMPYEYGCSADGRLFINFEIDSEILKIPDIKMDYKQLGVPISSQELSGHYYRRNLQTGIFEETTKLFSTFPYYFWSDSVFKSGDYKINVFNLDGKFKERTLYIHCPEFRYTCEDFKPKVNCYNTNDEKLVIEFSNININDKEKFELKDLNIYTKGTNERSNLLDNTLASDAKMEKIGDKYRIVSSLLYGNPNAGTNIINYVHIQPKACFYDLYPNAYVAQKCEGLKEVSSTSLSSVDTQITGNAVASEINMKSYTVYGVALLVLLVLVILIVRKKKRI
ncbi:MAG: hypothetical protein PHF86_08265 [Candidatus Nanoarchaeia archaeon]|nr:hypothetical protein [Candidatus Nanoarchaeia archaeon]